MKAYNIRIIQSLILTVLLVLFSCKSGQEEKICTAGLKSTSGIW